MTRRLLHLLNQRYRQQWRRAELLQAELGRCSWLGPLRGWVKALWRSLVPYREPTASLATELLEPSATPSGLVSIVLPFRDAAGLLRRCLRSLRRSTYPGRELVLVDNGSRSPRLRRWLDRQEARGEARVVRDPSPFNFSRLCNAGAAVARGDWLLFLNNDTEVITPDWLERMLAVAGRDDVAITGAGLYYPDGTAQHLGMALDTSGRWAHPHRGTPRAEVERHPWLGKPRAVAAVTGACLLLRAELFRRLGGFDEALPVEGNDTDLCLRASRLGKVAIVPEAQLLHYEGVSRGCGQDRIEWDGVLGGPSHANP
jgi:GT2 family glycosyltransferase